MFGSIPYDYYPGYDRWGRNDFWDMEEGSHGKIAIVGLPHAGKRTLCNSLWGWDVFSPQGDDPVAGDPVRNFGLFSLVDLPTNPFESENILFRLNGVELVVYVLSGESDICQDSFNWISRLRSIEATLLVVLNKADRLGAERVGTVVADLEEKLARKVIPLSAQNKLAVREEFLPVLLKTCPQLAVPLAAEVASLRRKVARKLIWQSMMMGSLANHGSMPLIEASALIGVQLRLVRQIGALYGHKTPNDPLLQMALTTAMGLFQKRYADNLTQALNMNDRAMAALCGAFSTWVIGRLAIAYYEAALPEWLERIPGVRKAYDVNSESGQA